MAKFHITEDGPKPCRARTRPCPIGGTHFENPKEAQKAYEEVMSNKENPAFTPISLSPATQAIVAKLDEAGIKALLVGGYVRDHLLGKESKDVDLELYGARADGSSLEFSDVTKLFTKAEGFSMDEAGASFSVLKVRVKGEDFDLALPRTEQSTGDHHRDYEVQHDSTMPFEEAASRRDFTINSMAYDPKTKELVDPYGGERDLKAGVLRHVGPAFSDDPLRCLRAVNFASRFNLQVAPETLSLCRELAPSYKTLARERVEEEFTKALLKGKHLDQGLKVFHDIGWSKVMSPFNNVSREDFAKIGEKLNETLPGDRRIVLAKMMNNLGYGDPTKLLTGNVKEQKRVNLTTSFINHVESDSNWGSIIASHRALKNAFPDFTNKQLSSIFDTLEVSKGNQVLSKLPETPSPAIVTGEKLIELGFKPGPEMGKIINKAQNIQDETGEQDFTSLLNKALTN